MKRRESIPLGAKPSGRDPMASKASTLSFLTMSGCIFALQPPAQSEFRSRSAWGLTADGKRGEQKQTVQGRGHCNLLEHATNSQDL